MPIFELENDASGKEHFISLDAFFKELLLFVYKQDVGNDAFNWRFHHRLIWYHGMYTAERDALHFEQGHILLVSKIVHNRCDVCECKGRILKSNANDAIYGCGKFKRVALILEHFLPNQFFQACHIRGRKSYVNLLHLFNLLKYPERNDNPPMTVDMTFWYKTKLYYLDCIDHEYAILTEDWKPLAKDSNFLRLLHKPIKQWHDKSFYELINQLLFEN